MEQELHSYWSRGNPFALYSIVKVFNGRVETSPTFTRREKSGDIFDSHYRIVLTGRYGYYPGAKNTLARPFENVLLHYGPIKK